MTEFLRNPAVSGGDNKFWLEDLVLIYGAKIICCWLSKSGDRENVSVGIQSMGFSKPFKSAIVNLTVILEDHCTNKNLDSMNEVSNIYFYGRYN